MLSSSQLSMALLNVAWLCLALLSTVSHPRTPRKNLPKMALTWHRPQDGSKMTPRWPPDGPQMASRCELVERCSQDARKMLVRCLHEPPRSRKCACSQGFRTVVKAGPLPRNGPRWPQDVPTMAHDGRKMAQDAPTMVQNAPT